MNSLELALDAPPPQKRRAYGAHESARMGKDEWLTPPEIIKALGEFDLDPCSPGTRRPWDTAKRHYGFTDGEDGLMLPWNGRVWLNPPYSNEAKRWLSRLAMHGDGIALIFARTETEAFFETVWGQAHGILFLKGRLHFHHVSGDRAGGNAGAPSCLVAYGVKNAHCLETCGIEGQFVRLR